MNNPWVFNFQSYHHDSLLGLEDELDAIYDNIFCGSDVLDLSEDLELTSDNTTVIFSLDGAQLYQSKK